jgi:hypothetical protein
MNTYLTELLERYPPLESCGAEIEAAFELLLPLLWRRRYGVPVRQRRERR